MTTIDPIDYTDEQLVAMAANVTAFLERAPFEEYSISYLLLLAVGNARGQLPIIAALRQRTQERDEARERVRVLGERVGEARRYLRPGEAAYNALEPDAIRPSCLPLRSRQPRRHPDDR